jgi:hypothetical protein
LGLASSLQKARVNGALIGKVLVEDRYSKVLNLNPEGSPLIDMKLFFFNLANGKLLNLFSCLPFGLQTSASSFFKAS